MFKGKDEMVLTNRMIDTTALKPAHFTRRRGLNDHRFTACSISDNEQPTLNQASLDAVQLFED